MFVLCPAADLINWDKNTSFILPSLSWCGLLAFSTPLGVARRLCFGLTAVAAAALAAPRKQQGSVATSRLLLGSCLKSFFVRQHQG